MRPAGIAMDARWRAGRWTPVSGMEFNSGDGGRVSRIWLRSLLIIGLLTACVWAVATAVTAAEAQAPSTLGRRGNTWAARSSAGQMYSGTWTATEDLKTGAVTGAWTLADAQGRTVASGGWSAAKSPTGWTGSWRAVATGRAGEYAGTWTATIDLKPETKLNDLFVKAIGATVSGTWQAGTQSGA